jgi:hypothetical protein
VQMIRAHAQRSGVTVSEVEPENCFAKNVYHTYMLTEIVSSRSCGWQAVLLSQELLVCTNNCCGNVSGTADLL